MNTPEFPLRRENRSKEGLLSPLLLPAQTVKVAWDQALSSELKPPDQGLPSQERFSVSVGHEGIGFGQGVKKPLLPFREGPVLRAKTEDEPWDEGQNGPDR